ncbi:MAG: cyclopropane-fatty-acyl-phospholipid synthase family protein [Candidatus Binatia bacterium]|nr:cyclopropane-fatty-acyl-phospholipid synthase family protein [Candidatus Binatia bacterium]
MSDHALEMFGRTRTSDGAPSWLTRRLVDKVLSGLASLESGTLKLHLPDGTQHTLGRGTPMLQVQIHRWETFRRILWEQDIGAGESYAEGWWDTNDLAQLCRLFVRADSALWNQRSVVKSLLRLPRAVSWALQRNTRSGSRRNIAHHYDLSNDFYRLFLDSSLTYSCALFDPPSLSLEQAQHAKLEFVCRQLGIQPGERVLEIGCGWGSFALHAAKHFGAFVHGISLSQKQLELARERCSAAGISDQVRLDFLDYRDLTGTYDHVVSIEMFEAVGHEYYPAFFTAVDRCLRPGGKFFLQTITIPDQRYDAYRREFDFIKKHIFPGGLLASLHRILWATKHYTQLRLLFFRDIGPHYARTLRTWREQFLQHLPQVQALGFDRYFTRLWEFYLASCEAAFAAAHIGDAQLIFERRA